MTHKTTWANSDGLTIGFGTNVAERQAAAVLSTLGLKKIAKVQIDLVNSTFGASGAKITIPAGSRVTGVSAVITEACAGGTSLAFGDAGNTSGWIAAADWATPALGVQVPVKGVYAESDNATTPAVNDVPMTAKIYATETDLYFTKVGTYTTGKADVFVEYI